MTLENALKKAAYKVWKELEPLPATSHHKIFDVREEGLTTMALKKLVKCNCPQIETITMASTAVEKEGGHDVELVIGSKSKGNYVRLFIQGKRLCGTSTNSNYDNLKLDFAQTDTLIAYSKSKSSLGMYAFYNHIIDNSLNLQNHYNSCIPFDKKSMGITITSAYSVKKQASNKFSKYHFNDGVRINPQYYSLRHFPDLFYYHNGSKNHLAVPFHELAYFTIDKAKKINELYKRIQKDSKLSFFFFWFPGLGDFLDGNENLIPILETDSQKLIADFKARTEKKNDIFNPIALIIIETGEEENIENDTK